MDRKKRKLKSKERKTDKNEHVEWSEKRKKIKISIQEIRFKKNKEN